MRDSALCHAGTERRLHIAPPSVWLCVIALVGRYPSVACVHLAPLRAGVAWVACLAGLARVRARVRAYEGTPHRLAGG